LIGGDRLRKQGLIITLITSFIIFQGIFVSAVFAEDTKNLEDIEAERKEVQENLSNHEATLTELYEDIESLNEEVDRLDRQVTEKESKVEEITYEIESTIDEIGTLQEEIETLNLSIEERFELLKSRASSYQKSGGLINYVEVLFGSQSFGDFISRLTAVNQIMDSDAAIMEQLENDMELVEEHKLTTMEKLDDLNEMHEKQKTELAQIEVEKEEQESIQQSLEAKQDELTAYVEELELEDRELASLEEKVKVDIAKAKREEERREEEKRKEERRLAIEQQEKEEREEQEAKEKKEDAELVQVAKVEEPKTASSQTNSSTPNQSKDTEKKSSNNKNKNKKQKENNNSNTFTVTSTAYTANCTGCSGVTSYGINLNNADSSTKVIAVDPSVIPLGTMVEVEGYGYAIAGDTGGAIKGKKIDVFFPNRSDALRWGTKTVKVTVHH
jgi:3D (Asp-Asp-Asp) domain-containing protein/peptidoglycan hydrolase CwlO-like protein